MFACIGGAPGRGEAAAAAAAELPGSSAVVEYVFDMPGELKGHWWYVISSYILCYMISDMIRLKHVTNTTL